MAWVESIYAIDTVNSRLIYTGFCQILGTTVNDLGVEEIEKKENSEAFPRKKKLEGLLPGKKAFLRKKI